ncbi:MAG TPA: HVO_0476 family zinc finger protein [Candidatus Thalassarchaeaceae archaeon]|nr:HVO_0476 family zinc finger protein [Candidatus Thalassarchaeaceae archaeon]MDP6844949.1 HVO_0476 family zinc finger protein [Candidatus Thalassarchaeaceae archaeon]HJM41403.1 HVO_0476 family zinc finger protein [Candidatus Thalassarchaeaceae archaeon]
MDEGVEELDNVTRCPSCNTRQAHEILKEKALKNDAGIDYLLRCEGCGNVHTVIFRNAKPVTIRFTLSDGPDSFPYELEVDDDEVFVLDDEFEAIDLLWRITRLETDGDAKPRALEARKVRRVWASRIDLARIKRTFSDGEISFSDSIEVEPEKVFSCGTIVKHRGETWRIRALHSGTARTLTGKMEARNIKRIFLHRPPSREEIAEKRKIERGNWKGQNFPGREEHQEKWRGDRDE